MRNFHLRHRRSYDWDNTILNQLALRNVKLQEVGSNTTTVDRFVSCNLTYDISRRSESLE